MPLLCGLGMSSVIHALFVEFKSWVFNCHYVYIIHYKIVIIQILLFVVDISVLNML